MTVRPSLQKFASRVRISLDSVEFEDGEVVDKKHLDWKRAKPLIG